MKNIFYITILSLFLTNCSYKNVVTHHGVSFLDKKLKKLEVNKQTKNDIISLLGSPSTKSKFDTDVWIYIENRHNQIKKSRKNEDIQK